MSNQVSVDILCPFYPEYKHTEVLERSSTVLFLKRRLQNSYLGHPAVESQRLICAGKLLEDEQRIDEISMESRISFHLVVRDAPKRSNNMKTSTPTLKTDAISGYLAIIGGATYLVQAPTSSVSQALTVPVIRQPSTNTILPINQRPQQPQAPQAIPQNAEIPPHPREPVHGAAAPVAFAQDDQLPIQNRENPLWLLAKLAFLVYLFTQRATFERKLLIYVAAALIFVHQMGYISLRMSWRPRMGQPQNWYQAFFSVLVSFFASMFQVENQ